MGNPQVTVSDSYYVYMLECRGNRLYTGITDDLKRRITEHCSGRSGAKFTRSFKPQAVICCWQVKSGRGNALRIEQYIKSKTRPQKIEYAGNPAIISEEIKQTTGILCDIRPCSKRKIQQLNRIIQDENRSR